MGRYEALLNGAAILNQFAANKLYPKLPLHFDGQVKKGFENVRKAFEQNFRDGWEPGGASFAVFVKGEKVVDIWGGYADKQAVRTWKEDTITITFSITKAVSALCIAVLADRGRLNYDDPVAKHWPGFAKNGKENITIEWVLSHMAGLPYLDAMITQEMALDHNIMREVLENEAPKLPPGQNTTYHAYTLGWLLDQIVRHIDEKHRGVGQFLREEITKPHGVDYHIGLKPSEERRVARMTPPSVPQIFSEMWHNPKVARVVRSFYNMNEDTLIGRAMRNTPWIDVADKCTVNSPELHALDQAALTGLGNARSLAYLFSLLINGRIVSQKTMLLLEKPVIQGIDQVLNCNTVKGHGFLYYPQQGKSEKGLIMGHVGYGCQQVMFDTENKIAFAYVTNGLKAGIAHICRNYLRLENTLYETLQDSCSETSTKENTAY